MLENSATEFTVRQSKNVNVQVLNNFKQNTPLLKGNSSPLTWDFKLR